jgi:hypothetical protein
MTGYTLKPLRQFLCYSEYAFLFAWDMITLLLMPLVPLFSKQLFHIFAHVSDAHNLRSKVNYTPNLYFNIFINTNECNIHIIRKILKSSLIIFFQRFKQQ